MRMAVHQASVNNPMLYYKTWDAPPQQYVENDPNNVGDLIKQAAAAAMPTKSGCGRGDGGGGKNGGNSGGRGGRDN